MVATKKIKKDTQGNTQSSVSKKAISVKMTDVAKKTDKKKSAPVEDQSELVERVSFDLDDAVIVEDDGSEDDVLLEVRKKEISRAGYEKLINELKDLEDNQIPAVNARIKEAREFGDLSENAEYQSSLNEKQMLETRITELRETIALSIVVDTNKPSGTVQYGSTVTFVFVDTDETQTVTIVGSAEVSYEKKVTQISFDSPIGMALEGKKVGDLCKVRAERGRFDIKIVNIA